MLLSAITFAFVLFDLLYSCPKNFYNDYLLYKTIENGNKPESYVIEDLIVPQLQILVSLTKIFQLDFVNIAQYHIVAGKHSSGKLTMSGQVELSRIRAKVRVLFEKKLVGEMNFGETNCRQEVIYVDINKNLKDLEDLGNALDNANNFKKCVSLIQKILGLDSSKISKWKSSQNAFKRAASAYKKKYKNYQFDNINKYHPKILDLLQEYAKSRADELKFTVAFITNDKSVLKRMRVCDDIEAKKLYELIGESLLVLNFVISCIKKKLSFEMPILGLRNFIQDIRAIGIL
ncbi:hypothetical protein C2G38_2172848 [Gigaspora rosea]|uniref:Uncharacterized protein n=1 Tax=Gigaspora rosea TaxID=44941 RepID=A0A397VV30_9GLOM|nr:hypothetical protein C2G38_2172848 [Gigaspora rosea]